MNPSKQEKQQEDMTVREFYSGFNLDFLNEEEKQTIYISTELYAKGKLRQSKAGEGVEQPAKETVWLKELIDIRNKLYNSLPTGEVNAYEKNLITMIKWHVNDIDVLCSRIAAPLPVQDGWIDDSMSETRLTIGRLEVNCFDEDSEMSMRVGQSRYESLSVHDTKLLANFILSHIKNETESNPT